MNRKLWSVLANHQFVAVVAADHPDDAWRIVSALSEFEDLPPACGDTLGLAPCPPDRARKTMTLARSLGTDGQFLACLRNGMVLTEIGDLSATLTPPDTARQVA